MQYNRNEALRYLGANKNDRDSKNLVDIVYLKMRNEVQARYIYKRYAIKIEKESVILENGYRFTSKDLVKHLAGCDEVILLAATLGSRIDNTIRRLTLESVAQGAAAQAVAAALIEDYCDTVQKLLVTDNLFPRPRFSPGYGDWNLEEQKLLFNLLDCPKEIGLTLSDGLMMIPSKSVTAIIGLSNDVTCASNKCKSCSNSNCPYRDLEC